MAMIVIVIEMTTFIGNGILFICCSIGGKKIRLHRYIGCLGRKMNGLGFPFLESAKRFTIEQ